MKLTPIALLYLLLSLASTPTTAQAPRVLFIGNSYTHIHGSLGAQVSALAEAAGQPPLDWAQLTAGGFTLERHLQQAETLPVIQQGWDFVVLQEQSQRPIYEPRGFLDSGLRLDAAIDAAEAQSVLFLTWARSFAPETQPALTSAYCALAEQADADVVAAGEVWQRVRQEHPEIALYESDGSHPSRAGVYLNSLLFYRLFYGTQAPSPDVAPPPDGVSLDVAAKLHAAAGVEVGCPPPAAAQRLRRNDRR